MLSSRELGGVLTPLVREREKNLLWLLRSDDPTFAVRALYPAERRWTLMKKAGEQTALCQVVLHKHGSVFWPQLCKSLLKLIELFQLFLDISARIIPKAN